MLTRKKLIIIVAASILLLILIIVAAIFIKDRQEAAEKARQEAIAGTKNIDKPSGEEITENSTREHDSGEDKNSIGFLGFGKLIERGLTMEQVTDTQDKFYQFSKTLDKPISMVSVYQDSIVRIMPEDESTTQTLEFKVQVNQSDDYNAILQYEDINTVRLKLTNPDSGQVVFEA